MVVEDPVELCAKGDGVGEEKSPKLVEFLL